MSLKDNHDQNKNKTVPDSENGKNNVETAPEKIKIGVQPTPTKDTGVVEKKPAEDSPQQAKDEKKEKPTTAKTVLGVTPSKTPDSEKPSGDVKVKTFDVPAEPGMPDFSLPRDLRRLPDIITKRDKRPRVGKKIAFFFLQLFVGVLCLAVIALGVLGVVVSLYLHEATQEDDTLLDLNQIKLTYTTTLVALDPLTEQYEPYQLIYGEENRKWIEYEDMSSTLINSIVASEDRRFWTHNGVDWGRTILATLNQFIPALDISETSFGASTIHQQLIKNLTGENQVDGFEGYLRKMREIYRAFMLNNEFSKEQVLEAYLNTFRLSGTIAGIESAANNYFAKTTEELTAAECAAIICITKSPNTLDPYTNPENNRRERDIVLFQMHDYGYLTDAEYEAAQKESDNMEFNTEQYYSRLNETYTFFTDTVIREVIADFQTYLGLTSAQANDLLYTGGLTIYTTIDHELQQYVDESMEYPGGPVTWEASARSSSEEAGATLQGASVILDFNGELKAVGGALGEKEKSLTTNYAVDVPRKTGSSMKPIAAYAPALEIGAISYGTMLPDAPIQIYEDSQWPQNYSNTFGQYGNTVSLSTAIAVSLNTTAVYALNLIGPEFAYDFLTTRLGITTLVGEGPVNDKTLSLALGGLTYGVSVYEMAAAYLPFGNGGYYYEPHSYTKIVDNKGNVILDKTSLIQPIKAMSDSTAYQMNQLLQDVMHAPGTGAAASFTTDLPLAGKSGTSTGTLAGSYDYWFIGMTPYYCMATWEGYVNPEMPLSYSSPSYSGPRMAWKYVMSRASEDAEYLDFPESDGVVSKYTCSVTGDLANSSCPRVLSYFDGDNLPDYCPVSHAAAEPTP